VTLATRINADVFNFLALGGTLSQDSEALDFEIFGSGKTSGHRGGETTFLRYWVVLSLFLVRTVGFGFKEFHF